MFEDASATVSVVDPNGSDGDDDQDDGEDRAGGVEEVKDSVEVALERVSRDGAVGVGRKGQ